MTRPEDPRTAAARMFAEAGAFGELLAGIEWAATPLGPPSPGQGPWWTPCASCSRLSTAWLCTGALSSPRLILDNLSAREGADIRRWAKKSKVELCFTPTYASWANPVEAHFGPLRQFTIANSHHADHTMQTRSLHAYLRWRNANARHPDVLAAQRRERARIRSEKGIRWGGRPQAPAA